MHTVGIRELKAHLSTYIGFASQGEEVVVTDRGREVALLLPITPERRTILDLVAEGGATWSGGKPAGLVGVTIEGDPLSATVIAERR
ncbi:MAG: type II toxin-antitoxin system prevent-host-death family antitoxin [Desulfuromonadales bacterium]|nr:type II toxin-antitoxin system prevent-host-death family antitoxin [Desulfuromonadales bacterium]